MEILQAILLGIIHGFTEWLPVSSSAHLAFFFRLFQQEPDFFMIGLLHFATLLSLIIYFRKDIKSYLTTYTNKTQKWHMLAIILPFFIVGFFYHTIFEQFLTNFRVIGWALIVNGVLLFGTGFVSKSTSMSLLKAIGIGLSQIFVLIPGTSRTGLFVSSGAYFRLEKEKIKQYLVL
ncbi:MAG: undecaprenyl-diphosphate phosphatase, partial [Candidatus Woesearchaeota archaeon]